MLHWISPLIAALLFAPLAFGLASTLLPAFGCFPPLGEYGFHLSAWRRLFELPGIWTSIRLSLVTGLGTTAISLGVVAAFCAAWQGTPSFRAGERMLAPLLAVPHAGLAFGLAFLLVPSGWFLRLLSPWATGFTTPPDWLIVHDPHGFTLLFGLIVKEVPYLLIMTLTALGPADAERSRRVAEGFGYRRMNGWFKVVFPRVYPQLRLPVYAVLAYGISVVDVAIILGPTTPSPLAPRLLALFNDPDLELRFVASAGALLQCGLVAAGVASAWVVEKLLSRLGTYWITSGQRGRTDRMPRLFAGGALFAIIGILIAAAGSIAVWSIAAVWRFPQALPTVFTHSNWTESWPELRGTLTNTLTLAAGTVALGLLLAIGVLENEARTGRRSLVSAAGFLYSPLIIPQMSFLFGAQMLLVLAHLDGHWLALLWVHLVFVFPYLFLSLSDSFHAWDERYARTALCLGASPVRVFFYIKFPMLLRPIAVAAAVGFSVSIALYLPTVIAGAGRHPTLTTEVVALAASGDSRRISVYAGWQMLLPLIGYALAIGGPAWLYRRRQGMQVTS